jgi:hypothetical protein
MWTPHYQSRALQKKPLGRSHGAVHSAISGALPVCYFPKYRHDDVISD